MSKECSCPTAAMKVILDLPPQDIFLESLGARWALRLANERELKAGDYSGHLRILNECKELLDVVVVTVILSLTLQFQSIIDILIIYLKFLKISRTHYNAKMKVQI